MKALVAALLLASLAGAAHADDLYVPIKGRLFRSALPDGNTASVLVKPFWLRRRPVSNAEFQAFVARHPQWQRGQVSPLLAGADYLGHWQAPLVFADPVRASQPVTRVSWHAAEAYCEAEQARLPGWYEWELVNAADATREDARSDARWRQQILDWYARPADSPLADVGQGPANVYGVQDMQDLVWEWVLDFNSLLLGDEAGGDLQKLCGGAALTLQQKENYAVLMRVAMLSSLHAADTGHALGFRCARDDQGARP